MTCAQMTNKVAFLCGCETFDGSNIVDADGYIAILSNKGISFKIDGEKVESEAIQSTFSKRGSQIYGRSIGISVSVEVKGGGVDIGTGELIDPEMSKLLQISGFRKLSGKKLAVSNLSGTFKFGESIQSAAASAASHAGTADLSLGYDWSMDNESFSITVNGVGPVVVNLLNNATSVATVVTHINSALATAGVNGVQAYDASNNHVGIRTTVTGAGQTFTLASGGDALTTLGWTASTYNGANATIVGTVFEIEPNTIWIYQVSDITVGSEITGVDSGATADVDSEADLLVYKPLTEDCNLTKSGIITYHQHNTQIHTYGCRSDVSFTFEKIPTAALEATGMFSLPIDAPLPTPVISDVKPPIFIGVTFGIGDLDTSDVPISKAELKIGAATAKKQGANSPDGVFGFYHSDRVVTATLDPDVVRLIEWDPYTLAKDRTEMKVFWEYGTQVGNRIRCVLPRSVIADPAPERADSDNRYKYTCNFEALGVNDDELFIVIY